MIDLIYIAATLAFFALMLGYAHACDTLGRAASASTDLDAARSESARP